MSMKKQATVKQTVSEPPPPTQSKTVPAPTFKEEPPKRPENLQQLQDRLRDSCLAYKEMALRCQMTYPKGKKANETFNRLYYQPQIPFLQDPEIQKAFRTEFLSDVTKIPEPKPIETIADQIHAEVSEVLADQSNPSETRQQMYDFYTRRQTQLQHKKHKLLKRWANVYQDSGADDHFSPLLDKELMLLQVEQENVASRLMRLQGDDNYCHDDKNPRFDLDSNQSEVKGRNTKLYKEADEQANDSSLRQDDFEVYIRLQSYENKVNRNAKKLVQAFNWLSHQNRYDIWFEARKNMDDYCKSYEKKRVEMYHEIAKEIQIKLNERGIFDEKGIEACQERYLYHLKQTMMNRSQQMEAKLKFQHYEPYILCNSKAELKIYLIQIAKEYGLNTTQIDLDNGQLFTYQLQQFFPSKFEQQVRAMSFDWEDTGPNADIQMIDRLSKTLGLDKDQMLTDMAKYANDQRTQSLLNALNVGKTGQQDLSLKDLTENELNSEQFSRHNLLKKLKQVEFFNLDYPKNAQESRFQVRVRKADWLEYVCWQPQISIQVQRQNHNLSKQQNTIDNLLKSAFEFADVNDSVIVNKIIEDSIKTHLQKVQEAQQRIAKCQYPSKNQQGQDNQIEGQTQSLREACNPEKARSKVNQIDQNLTEAQQIQYHKFQDVPNVDPLTHNLTKAYYTMRVVKTRDKKIQLLSVINYFRAIQRVLALDMRQFMSRDRAMGDALHIIEPHFGYNAEGKEIIKTIQPQGPGDIFNTTVEMPLDTQIVKGKGVYDEEPVTFKAYKLRNTYDPEVMSTCPIVPKHHRTFGRPSIYEHVSKENEREKDLDRVNWIRMQSLLNMRDRIHVDLESKELFVTNEFGMRIVYHEAFADMMQIEEELIKIGSYYINKYEYVIKNNEVMASDNEHNRPASMVDRPQMALDLLDKEFQFQFAKVQLVELYMEVYEHIVDPLESTRMLQVIADLIAQRPRLNMEALMYAESYTSEVELLKEKAELVKQFLQMQKKCELEENEKVQNYIERKIRKIQESKDEYWRADREKDKTRRVGSNETSQNQAELESNADQNVDEILRQKLDEESRMEASRQEEINKIRQRHITEFANEQFSDFASVLGLPQVTLKQLYERFDESEPIVIDALRENAFFSKMIEGFPSKLQLFPDQKVNLMGTHLVDCNVIDFYVCMNPMSKLNAALVQSFETLESETQPENGFASSMLETAMIRAAIKLLQKRMKAINDGVDSDYLQGQELLEEDFYLGNPDSLVYLMKKMHEEAHPSNLYKQSDPLVISKLDHQTIKNFNFPRIKPKEVYDRLTEDGISEMRAQEYLIQKTIQMAKTSVARPNLSFIGSTNQQQREKEENQAKAQAETQIFVPSMMKMFCNITEVIRLREEIVLRMNECIVLRKIYEYQLKETGKQGNNNFGEPIQFNTNSVTPDIMNLVDLNEGTELPFDRTFPFMEYDRMLAANLNFKSDSCIKALFTDLGVEEMRAILHCQLAHQKLLLVAVRVNQLLIDKPLKGKKETELVAREILVPNSVIDYRHILSGSGEHSKSDLITQQYQQMTTALSKGYSDCIYTIMAKKTAPRKTIGEIFAKACQNLIREPGFKAELVLRTLRALRVQLCYGYCQSMINEAVKDSVKIQLLETCNQLRLRATLLSDRHQLFRLGKSDTSENLSYTAYHQLKSYKEFDADQASEITCESILEGQVCNQSKTIYYIPSSSECCLADRFKNDDREGPKVFSQVQRQNLEQITAETADLNIKKNFKRLKKLTLPLLKREGKHNYPIRRVKYEDVPDLYQHKQYQLLLYVTQVLSIFDLEYTMLRNYSDSWRTQQLEDRTQSGRPFWTEVEDKKRKIASRKMQEHQKESASEFVIEKLDQRKKAWIDLDEDMGRISSKLKKIEKGFKDQTSDKRSFDIVLDLLILQHQSSYYTFLNGLETRIDHYLDQRNDEYFAKLLEVRNVITNKNSQQIKMIKSNGFYVQSANIAPSSIKVDATEKEEFDAFKLAHQTVIDEKCLMPRKVTLVRQLFGSQAQNQQYQTKFGYNHLFRTAFYNIEEEDRKKIATNFNQIDELVDDYLVFKNHKPGIGEKKTPAQERNYMHDQLVATVEILSYKIEAGHLSRVMMSWNQKDNLLPIKTEQYKNAFEKFNSECILGILHERDTLNDQYWARYKLPKPKAGAHDRESEALYAKRQMQKEYYSKINQIRAESIVVKNTLEVNLIKLAIDIIQAESNALHLAFECSAENRTLMHHVKPCQQFASVPYSKVDIAPLLDVTRRIGPLQTFLTRLRNRCTEVETLTSGPGLVFSIKDFNDCLSSFGRQLIKIDEEALRLRSEQANIREHQYRHLIYIKQMENLYYRKKCEHLLVNIETLTNAKMLSQGNQMIYELDMGARELQTLKDHYYVMEKEIRAEVHKEYQDEIRRKDQKIKELNDDFQAFRSTVALNLSEQISKEIKEIEEKAKTQVERRTLQRLIGGKSESIEHNQRIGSDPELCGQLLHMTKQFRKQKLFHNFTTVISAEKNEKEMAVQKLKLTQNMQLWEQLAEAEKREQITNQELQITKNNLIHYTKLIEKLFQQQDHLQQQKSLLEKSKKTNSKQIKELENKMQDLEILESLDLNKILEELRKKDRKILTLDRVDQNFNERLEQMEEIHRQEVAELNLRINKERQAKLEAFEKLDAMRIEMKTLEGKDSVKNDLWQDKCKELYQICRELQSENENLQTQTKQLTAQLEMQKNVDLHSHTLQNSTSDASNYQPLTTMTREQIILQRRKYANKPHTASSEHGGRRHIGRTIGQRNQNKLIESANNLDSLKISAEGQGYDRRGLNTIRNAAGNQTTTKINPKNNASSSSNIQNTDMLQKSFPAPNFLTVNQKSAGVFGSIPNMASMPQIKGTTLPNVNIGANAHEELTIDSGSKQIRK